ncbi:MAG: tetratricopeptide repeat protein [Phycisphaerae bacterium]
MSRRPDSHRANRWWLLPVLGFALACAAADRYGRMTWPFDYRLERLLPPIPAMPRIGDAEMAARLADRYEAVAARPKDADANGALGMMLHACNLRGEADACYARAILLDPRRFDWRYYCGRLHAEAGRTEAAIEALRSAARLASDYTPALLALADLHLQRNEPSESREWCDRALALDARCAAALWRLGRIAAHEGDADGAAAWTMQAVELAPDFGEAHYALAVARPGGRDAPSARQALRRMFASTSRADVADPLLDELNALRRNGSSELASGVLHLRAGRYDQAILCLEQAIEKRPSDAHAHFRLGRAGEGAGDADRAIAAYRVAVRLQPDHAGIRIALVEVLQRSGQRVDAVHHGRAALALDPTDAAWRERLEVMVCETTEAAHSNGVGARHAAYPFRR